LLSCRISPKFATAVRTHPFQTGDTPPDVLINFWTVVFLHDRKFFEHIRLLGRAALQFCRKICFDWRVVLLHDRKFFGTPGGVPSKVTKIV
jgi:hypothetical protein